jgi:hypothetical protein
VRSLGSDAGRAASDAAGGGEVVAGAVGVAGCSAGCVVVPGRLKFWSSRGPIASGAGAWAGGGSATFCAAAIDGASTSAPHAVMPRKIALIAPACA